MILHALFKIYGFLPPTNEVCEGYVFTPVCQSFCSQEGAGCISQHALRQTPPCAVHAGRYGQQAGGTHPIVMRTC